MSGGESARPMKKHSWEGMVSAEVLPRLPELGLTRAVLHRSDVEWLLCGAIEIRSLFSRAFTVEVFVMPLWAPAENVCWLVGERLGRLAPGAARWWDPATTSTAVIGAEIAAGLRDGALEYWDRLGDVSSFAAACRRRATYASSLHYLEWVAGAAILAGDGESAADAFASARRVGRTQGWETRARARLDRLERAWSTDRHTARALLREVRDHTATAIGLT